jgi:hypothetical protein
MAARAYYAILDDTSGALTMVQGTLYFVPEDSSDIVEITPEHVNFLVTLGQMTLADGQRIEDLMAGGAVSVCLSREEGRN